MKDHRDGERLAAEVLGFEWVNREGESWKPYDLLSPLGLRVDVHTCHANDRLVREARKVAEDRQVDAYVLVWTYFPDGIKLRGWATKDDPWHPPPPSWDKQLGNLFLEAELLSEDWDALRRMPPGESR